MNTSEKTGQNTFFARLGSMLRVDGRRVARSRVFYILIAAALLMPILMTVMMAMMDGSVSIDPVTGAESVMHGPENAWQNIGAFPSVPDMGGAEIFAMCNINMVFMLLSVFVCLLISDDFRSGYAKNLFTVRAHRGEYVASKIIFGSLTGALMLVAYLIGSLLGGAIAGLSFSLHGLTVLNIVMCMLAKICLVPVFVSIFTLISVAAKKRAWLAICGSLGGGMLLFMTVSMVSPLSATAMHVLLCLAGGVMFAIGFGAAARFVLRKTSLV